ARGKPLQRDHADAVLEIGGELEGVELRFHEECFARHGHFAGDDQARLAAVLDCANDPAVDAVWFAHGGYGSNRIAAEAVSRMEAAAQGKPFLGYSDTGYLLAALYRAGVGRPAHGPMVADVRREEIGRAA